MEIIHYLNNHRGGFFKFFSEPEETPVASQQSDGGSGSLFSILSALTGGGGGGGGQSYTTPRPVPRPTQRPSTDIASGIGSFFTQVLSEYLNGVEYQRRRRRRSLNMDDDFHDEEDNLDTQTSQLVKFQDDEEEEAAKAHTELIGVLQFPEDEGESRVINFKDIQSEEQHEEGAVRFPDATPADVIRDFNRDAAQRKLRFPQDQDEPSANVRKAKDLSYMDGWKVVLPNGLSQSDLGVDKRRGKRTAPSGASQRQMQFSGTSPRIPPVSFPPLDGIIKFLAAITAGKSLLPVSVRNCKEFKFYIQQDIWLRSCFYIAPAQT